MSRRNRKRENKLPEFVMKIRQFEAAVAHRLRLAGTPPVAAEAMAQGLFPLTTPDVVSLLEWCGLRATKSAVESFCGAGGVRVDPVGGHRIWSELDVERFLHWLCERGRFTPAAMERRLAGVSGDEFTRRILATKTLSELREVCDGPQQAKPQEAEKCD